MDAVSRESLLNKLHLEMLKIDRGNPKRIQHFCKVHGYARLIGMEEGLDPDTLFILEVAALTHDIGIGLCDEKYGKHDGPLQEKEGAKMISDFLKNLGFDESVISRVKFLIAHHHSYLDIQGLDYQILVEADFLVNLHERGSDPETIKNTFGNIFTTTTGRRICQEMFGL